MTSFTSYTGFITCGLDEKFRVHIPAQWRPEAGEPVMLLCSTVRGMQVVKVLTLDGYLERQRIIADSDLSPARKHHLHGSLAACCREVTLNQQGMLPLPKELCEWAGLAPDTEVVLAGRGKHLEILSVENFHAELETLRQDSADLGLF